MATDKRSVLGDQEKEEEKVPEVEQEGTPEPEAGPEKAAEEPPQRVEPMGMEYVKNVAKGWPTTAQAPPVIANLPQGIDEMLTRQSDDFILGFANGIQCIHDICLKVLLDQILQRQAMLQKETPTNIATREVLLPSDRLTIHVTAVAEGIGWQACKVLSDRTDKPEEPDETEE